MYLTERGEFENDEEWVQHRKQEDEGLARAEGHQFEITVPLLRWDKSALDGNEEMRVRRLIAKYADIFNDGTRPLSVTNLLRAKLDTGDTPPISFPPRRVAPFLRDAMTKEVERSEERRVGKECRL